MWVFADDWRCFVFAKDCICSRQPGQKEMLMHLLLWCIYFFWLFNVHHVIGHFSNSCLHTLSSHLSILPSHSDLYDFFYQSIIDFYPHSLFGICWSPRYISRVFATCTLGSISTLHPCMLLYVYQFILARSECLEPTLQHNTCIICVWSLLLGYHII